MKPRLTLPRDDNHTGRDLGEEEIALLTQAIKSGCLTSTRGTMVKALEENFARKHLLKHCVAASSGTAALHAAVAALDPEPGDEIVTTPITDMGAIAPMLYQGAIPIFADVDPDTYNVTAATIAPRITQHTRAIMVTHLFGNPCDMDPILTLAARYGLPVIEDCSQAFLAEYRGRRVGTMGSIGCFSLQQGKHMTCGEGGLTVTDDPALGRRLRLYVNKAWGYGDQNPDHYFLALNYRMTELQGAVALAQLDKLDGVVARRRRVAAELTSQLSGVAGLAMPVVTPGGLHSYWKFPIQVDEAVLGVDVSTFAKRLAALGVVAQPRYIQKPAFECEVLRDQKTFGKSGVPFRGLTARGSEVRYDPAGYPGTRRALSRVLVMPINEFYTSEHVEFIAEAVHEAVRQGGA
jgi:perosamine synthetase